MVLKYPLSETYLSYCTIVWRDKNNSNLDSLFNTQKEIIRTCTKSIWLEHKTPLKQIKNLWHLYSTTCNPYVPAKTYFHLGSQIINSLSNQIFINIILGMPFTFISILLILNLLKNAIKTQGPMIRNSINKTIKNCNSLVSFKKTPKNVITIYSFIISYFTHGYF